MENYYIAAVEIGILKGKLSDPIRGNKAFQTIAADNSGVFGGRRTGDDRWEDGRKIQCLLKRISKHRSKK
jgi:hypothetical protein